MYMCEDCGKVFLEDDVVKSYDDPSPIGVALSAGEYEYWHCPKCRSENLHEATECMGCGDWFIAYGMDKLCPDCAEYFTGNINDLMSTLGLSESEFLEVYYTLY